ncbi:hypothetical protein Mal15_19560 [Stieleria maiorica]|uniref:Phage integrase family protein n=1 Tax=Stieleria maiorica TaxID=2795974 RepID=A0A5B9MD81_9BACT|nr:site-specific integrase [Stieleria maiorica]QEF97910.1 hypothetical protein Mal15_19560 [Stieleria maiorica]
MPKLTTSHPKYRKHRASGQAIVTLDGRDFYLGPHGSRASKLEFDRLILEYLANDRSLPREEEASLTVAQVLNKYRKFAERYYKKNGTPTSEAYAIKTIIRPIRQLYGAIHRACDVAFPPDTPLEGDALKIWQSEHRWSPNRLRHTRGTEVRKQFGLEAAQVILGHSVANVTEIYAERDAEKARDVARKTG